METLTLKLASVLIAGFLCSPALAASPVLPTGTFQIDSAHSKVGFEVPHMVISAVSGQFAKIEGSIEMADKVEKSNLSASVDVDSLNTGVKKRDDHLRSPDFFDIKKFPKMTFKTTSVTGTADKMKLAGDLTIKGITKNVTLDGKYLGALPDDGMGNERVAFEATGKINRKDFGLTWNKMVEAGPVVGDEVQIHLRTEGVRAKLASATKKK